MSQVDLQAFQSLEIPPDKVDNWYEVTNKYMTRKSVITRKIKMWNNRLQSTKLTIGTVRGASIENLTNFNTVMESIDTVATKYVTDIIQCLHKLGDTYLVVEEKKTSIQVSPALEPASAPNHKYIDRSNIKPKFVSTNLTSNDAKDFNF